MAKQKLEKISISDDMSYNHPTVQMFEHKREEFFQKVDKLVKANGWLLGFKPTFVINPTTKEPCLFNESTCEMIPVRHIVGIKTKVDDDYSCIVDVSIYVLEEHYAYLKRHCLSAKQISDEVHYKTFDFNDVLNKTIFDNKGSSFTDRCSYMDDIFTQTSIHLVNSILTKSKIYDKIEEYQNTLDKDMILY